MRNLFTNKTSIFSLVIAFVLVLTALSFPVSAAFEIEPNNDMAHATSISVNTKVSGSLAYSNEDDYFKFTLSRDGMISLTMKSGLESGGYTQNTYFYVLDSSGKELQFNIVYDSDINSTVGMALGLAAGTYYIKVNRSWENNQYEFTVNYKQSEFCEKEPNDNRASATTIQPNTMNKGASNSYIYGDDYYRFYLPENGRISIVSKHLSSSSYGESSRIRLYDSNNNELYDMWVDNGNLDNTVGDPVGLAKGTYYLLFNGSCEYSIGVTYQRSSIKLNDIKIKSYYAMPAFWAIDKNITKGVSSSKFAPGSGCTRGEVVTFLWRANGSPTPKSTYNPFSDVKSSSYCYKAVLWAVENNITKGITENSFAPNQVCTRGQVVTFLWRANGQPKFKSSKTDFVDVDPQAYYYSAMLWATENDVTTGTTVLSFSPNQKCTRGQVVSFLFRSKNILPKF